MNKNPFTLMYGIETESNIDRNDYIDRVVSSFVNDSNMYAYLITGVRGMGKTVLLRTIEKQLNEKDDWITISINPQGKIINSFANRLYDVGISNKIIGKWSFSINLEVITLTRENGDKVSDPEIIIEHLLEKYYDKKILITIDEVNDTGDFREFINFYQILIGKKYPVYLLMTALKENINSLTNDKAMTFLSRAPKIELKPLNLFTIATEYMRLLPGIKQDTAIQMAKLTKGYPFAYQVLGYLFFEKGGNVLDEKLIDEYTKYLWNNGYSKFYKDLTEVEKLFVIALAKTKTGSKEEIVSQGKFKAENYSKYRERLIEKGIIYQSKYGYLDFVLPLFKEFVCFITLFD